jgi:Fur family transcriptional regulator, ferric uptake regulator
LTASPPLKKLAHPLLKDIELDLIEKDLKNRGYRLTKQRLVLYKLFCEQPDGEHLSAEELFDKLKTAGIEISLATTYRTLKLLVNLGLIRELDFAEGHKHYELNKPESPPHHHLICVGCAATLEFTEDTLMMLGQRVAQDFKFQVVDVQFKVFALCPTCQTRPAHQPLKQNHSATHNHTYQG